MLVILTQGSFIRGIFSLATKRFRHACTSDGMSPNSRIQLLVVFALDSFGE